MDYMMAEKLMKKSEYAAHRKCRPETVSRYFKTGKLDESCLTTDKKIRVAKADRMLQERLAPIQQKASMTRFNETIQQAGIDNQVITLFEAQRLLTSYKAAREKLKYESEKGNLLDREKVAHAAAGCAVRVRDAMLNIPDRIAAILSAESNEAAIRSILDAEIRLALNELSAEF